MRRSLGLLSAELSRTRPIGKLRPVVMRSAPGQSRHFRGVSGWSTLPSIFAVRADIPDGQLGAITGLLQSSLSHCLADWNREAAFVEAAGKDRFTARRGQSAAGMRRTGGRAIPDV
jgi:hypothetical protein